MNKTFAPLLLAGLLLTACQTNEKLSPVTPNPSTKPPGITSPIVTNPAPGQTKIESTDNAGKKLTLQSGEKIELSEFGLKDYPHLLTTKGKPQTTFTNKADSKDANLTLFTLDSPDRVADFYESQITSHKSKSVTKNTAVIGGLTSTGAEVFIVASKLDAKTQISITASLKQ